MYVSFIALSSFLFSAAFKLNVLWVKVFLVMKSFGVFIRIQDYILFSMLTIFKKAKMKWEIGSLKSVVWKISLPPQRSLHISNPLLWFSYNARY